MNEYTAKFNLILKDENKIRTSEISLPQLNLAINPDPLIKNIKLTPILKEKNQINFISEISVEVVYLHENLRLIGEINEGIEVCLGREMLCPPCEIAKGVIMPILYWLSGLTGQADICYDMRENIKDFVSDFVWILPDGKKAGRFINDYPFLMSAYDPRLFGEALNLSDWESIPDLYTGKKEVPLWKIIFARAIREQKNEARNVIIQCATALEVGVSPYLPATMKFNMDVFNGNHRGKIRTPDLRNVDESLYETLKQLWYTRHAIAHKGKFQIYNENPLNKNAKPLRAVEFYPDIPNFLVAVPKGIKFIEENLP